MNKCDDLSSIVEKQAATIFNNSICTDPVVTGAVYSGPGQIEFKNCGGLFV